MVANEMYDYGSTDVLKFRHDYELSQIWSTEVSLQPNALLTPMAVTFIGANMKAHAVKA